MKNQYVGDIGDYGKYALLRAFAYAGIKVGVNWYLTENDESNDGKFTQYLEDEGFRKYCPEVYDVLKKITGKKNKSVQDISKSGIIPDAVFYADKIDVCGGPKERNAARDKWFEKSLKILSGAELIFMDPDNGLLETGDGSKRGAEKYIFPEEAERYFREGKNVVYYCHKGRRKYNAWMNYISFIFNKVPEAMTSVLTFHKGSQRSYVFMIHKDSYKAYRIVLDDIKRKWFRIFTEEFTNLGDVAEKQKGEFITLEEKDGTLITLKKRTDGNLEIHNSNDPNTCKVFTPEMFDRWMNL